MSRKYIDIMPPYPKKERTYHKESPKKKQKRKSISLFLTILGFILLLAFIYLFLIADGQIKTTVDTPKSTQNNQFELFDTQGDSTLTNNSNPIIVRIINGSPDTNNATKARDLLLKNGFKIEKLEKSSTEYDKTIIYYKNKNQTSAQKVLDSLKGTINATIQESQNLDQSYDILIVIGAS